MNHKIFGRSPIINIIALIINLFAVMLVWNAFLNDHWLFGGVIETWHKYFAVTIFSLSLITLLIMQGGQLLIYAARIILGGTLIVSGLIKGNDPKGFAYKLEEYFEQGALAYRVREIFGWDSFNLEVFIPLALTLAYVIFIIEVVLGVLALTGVKNKLNSILLVLMMGFFGFLTIHTATCEPTTEYQHILKEPINSSYAQRVLADQKSEVPTYTILEQKDDYVVFSQTQTVQCVNDCGCFGDALKGSIGRSLSPWESFGKDGVLLYFSFVLLLAWGKVKPAEGNETMIIIVGGALVATFFSWLFSWWFILIFYFLVIIPTFLFLRNKKQQATLIRAIAWPTILSFLVGLYVITYLPLKDYRPWAIGNEIQEQLTNGYPEVSEMTFLYKNAKTGEIKSISGSDSEGLTAIGQNKDFAYDSYEKIVIEPGKDNSLQDFGPELYYNQLTPAQKADPVIDSLYKADFDSYYVDGVKLENKADKSIIYVSKDDYHAGMYNDTLYDSLGVGVGPMETGYEMKLPITHYYLNQENVLFITVLKQEEVSDEQFGKLDKLVKGAKEKGFEIVVFAAQGPAVIMGRPGVKNWGVPVLDLDQIVMKAMVRSDAGVIQLNNGIVVDKWPKSSIPGVDKLK